MDKERKKDDPKITNRGLITKFELFDFHGLKS